MVYALHNINNELTSNLGKYEKKFTYINSIQYNMDRNFINNFNQALCTIEKRGLGEIVS